MTDKQQELSYLYQAHQTTDFDEKQRFFDVYSYLREQRSLVLGEAMKYEKAIETIEGTAEYLGIMSLKTLSEKHYLEQLNRASQWLIRQDQSLLDTRRMAYY